VRIFRWIEDKIDKITPKIEVSDFTETKFDSDSFNSLISKLETEPYFKLRSKKDNEFVLNVSGKTVDFALAKMVLGKNPTPKMYKNLKSRFKVTHLNDGRLEIVSFEYVVSVEKEIEANRGMLKLRLV
jgi:hypothetical protein